VGLSIFLVMQPLAHCQWMNDDPIWEYEDETPIIPADVRLKMHDLSQAYNQAGDYANKHFLKEYRLRDPYNTEFSVRWQLSFFPRWIAFNDYLDRYQRSVWINASSVSATGTTVDLQHSQLAGATRNVARNLVSTAQGLTPYLENDKVVAKWEIFINRLKNIVDALQELE
jgi:hypothetical protein